MLNRVFGAKTHSFLNILGLSGLAFGLPMNKVVMSVSMMFLALNLLLEADFKSYWNNLRSNRLFHLILAFFLFHALSLAWSSDFNYGLNDLRVKLPMLIVPLVLVAKPIDKTKDLKLILFAFLSSILITSLINFGTYNQWFGHRDFNDIRGMSIFGSHVRYAILISMAIGVLIHLHWKKQVSLFILLPIFIWLNFYTYFSQVLSGAITLFGVYVIATFFWVWQKQKFAALTGLALICITTLMSLIWLFKPITYEKSDYTYKTLGYKTAEGNTYYHKPSIVSPETGKPIDILICHIELKREWEKVSTIPYDGFDIKGQPISRTIIRYMASKDLTKDAIGFQELKEDDINAIEKGYATYRTKGIASRISGLRFQLNNASDPNGHSFLQRLEYWKTGTQIVKNNWFLGVGNGDVQRAFNEQYTENRSLLTEENRDRAHNMYLTFLLSLGVIGFGLFIWSHICYFITNFKKGNLLAVIFMTIILISYLVEDTLETQTGITFFSLFFGLFIQNEKKVSNS